MVEQPHDGHLPLEGLEPVRLGPAHAHRLDGDPPEVAVSPVDDREPSPAHLDALREHRLHLAPLLQHVVAKGPVLRLGQRQLPLLGLAPQQGRGGCHHGGKARESDLGARVEISKSHLGGLPGSFCRGRGGGCQQLHLDCPGQPQHGGDRVPNGDPAKVVGERGEGGEVRVQVADEDGEAEAGALSHAAQRNFPL